MIRTGKITVAGKTYNVSVDDATSEALVEGIPADEWLEKNASFQTMTDFCALGEKVVKGEAPGFGERQRFINARHGARVN